MTSTSMQRRIMTFFLYDPSSHDSRSEFLSRPVSFPRVLGFGIYLSILALGIRLFNFLPLYHHDAPSVTGRIWGILAWVVGPGFCALLINIHCRQALHTARNNNGNTAQAECPTLEVVSTILLFFLFFFFRPGLTLVSLSSSSTYYRCFLYIRLRHFDLRSTLLAYCNICLDKTIC